MNNRGFAAFLGQLRGDRALRRTAVLGLGAAAVGAGKALAQEPEPTPVGPSQLIVQPIPTEPPPPIDDFAAAPTPTIPPSGPPTGPTVTPVPETGEPPLEPTPTPELQVISQPGDGGQESPLPGGGADPDNWICKFGPWGPWYPIVPDPGLTGATDITWYGVQVDQASGRLEAAAFGTDGQELSRVSFAGLGAETRGTIADAGTSVEIAFTVETRDGAVAVAGEIAGQRFATSLRPGDEPAPDRRQTVALNDAQVALLERWAPAMPKLEGLLSVLTARGGTSETGGQTGCFIAGFVLLPSIVGCAASLGLGCAATGIAGSYVANHCTD